MIQIKQINYCIFASKYRLAPEYAIFVATDILRNPFILLNCLYTDIKHVTI